MTDLADAAREFRLPPHVRPIRYDLHLAPDLERARFVGDERIEIELGEPTDTIVLNALDLEIARAALHAGSGTARPLEVTFDAEHEEVALRAADALPPGRYVLEVDFAGTLNDKLVGFYRSTFVDDSGTERVIATTQFEETDARRAFPCFDEPDKKAVFAVTLDVADGLLAVSNSEELSSEPLETGGRRVRFADTIVMSTYLVAFVVGPLEATEPVVAEGVTLRVVHAPGRGHLTKPALDCAAHALSYYRDYFGIPYPASKLDLVALPDFAAGAMENLGCVTFREAILLADEATTSRPELQRLAEVVEHEIAHMWFGDLVTMKWWNGIWLNEAFATFMALRCQNDYRPEWTPFVSFSRDKSAALGIDGLHTTRPVEYPVRRPDEAAAMFDVLTYEKGASVLWMLERYVGEDVFRAGVRRYLAAHQYGNTETTDLFDAIEAEVGDGAIRAVMDTWIFQGGYPLLSVVARDGEAAELRQRPFAYLEKTDFGTSAIGSNWIVPVILRHGDADQRLLLRDEPAKIATDGLSVVNAGGAGFYRVRYEGDLLTTLLSRLDELTASERYSVVSDLWAATLAGVGTLAEVIDAVDHLRAEQDPDVWSVVVGTLGFLDRIAEDADRDAVQRFSRSLLAPQLERVGWEKQPGEDERVALLRSSLVAALGTFARDETVVRHARALFAADHERHEPVDADLVNAVLAVVTANATRAEFDAILARYREPESPMDQVRHLNCLANLTDVDLAAVVWEMCRGEVRSQNAPYLLGGMLRGREVGQPTWDFVREHFEELAGRFPANSIHRMLDGVTSLVQADAQEGEALVTEIRSVLDRYLEPGRRRLVEQSIERLRVNQGFADRERPRLGALLPAR